MVMNMTNMKINGVPVVGGQAAGRQAARRRRLRRILVPRREKQLEGGVEEERGGPRIQLEGGVEEGGGPRILYLLMMTLIL